jgi:hypothetical protein
MPDSPSIFSSWASIVSDVLPKRCAAIAANDRIGASVVYRSPNWS